MKLSFGNLVSNLAKLALRRKIHVDVTFAPEEKPESSDRKSKKAKKEDPKKRDYGQKLGLGTRQAPSGWAA